MRDTGKKKRARNLTDELLFQSVPEGSLTTTQPAEGNRTFIRPKGSAGGDLKERVTELGEEGTALDDALRGVLNNGRRKV